MGLVAAIQVPSVFGDAMATARRAADAIAGRADGSSIAATEALALASSECG